MSDLKSNCARREHPALSRRQLLIAGAGLLAVPLLAPVSALADTLSAKSAAEAARAKAEGARQRLHLLEADRPARPGSETRELSLLCTHTGERRTLTYWQDGAYLPKALDCATELLRDHRCGEEHPVDPALLDLLHAVVSESGSQAPVQVVSGYRSPRTNALLRQGDPQVAKHSYHTRGMAIDFRLSDVPLSRVHRIADRLIRGGVGLYPASGFVHIDSGPQRRWCGKTTS